MIPQRHPRTTRQLTWNGGASLAVYDTTTPCRRYDVMETVWEPTPDELTVLNSGGIVKLSLIGTKGHPPVAINAVDRGEL